MFKKILKWFGVILLGIILLFILVAVYTGYKQSGYKETAVPYIKEVIPAISEWDTEKAKQFFVPSTFDNVSQDDFEKLFRFFSKLGSLKSMDEPVFNQVQAGATIQEGANTIVTYTVLAHYENGDAQITIRLLDLGGSFEVYYFNVNSTVFIE
ncbi:hypothetical protein PY479_07660 [Shewanella sp. A32]|uniref:hypothetical protein n=1 Tax=Shewanella sp. A32 TaxID=3031327 RepID=UPI0023B8FC1B|nr:hypothetical protein [Shewanella sp. A32]MDF0534149.1 hypothetical protein [Shewanella sp. A32]